MPRSCRQGDATPRTLHEIVTSQAAATAYRTAIVEGERRLTYGELDARANQLAHCLQAYGVSSDVLVAVCLERSVDLVVSVLGILKAGGGYVPLDPASPPERIRCILADSRPPVLVTRSSMAGLFAGYSGRVIAVDAAGSGIEGRPVDTPRASSGSEHLAYVMYTSGSTGLPKGVMVEHRSAVNCLLQMQRLCPVEADDVYLSKSNPAFDASVLELFGWPWKGGALAVLPAGEERDPLAILGAIARHRVTHLVFVPSLLQAMLDGCSDRELAPLRQVKYVPVGGEALSRKLAARLRALGGPVRFFNAYGPTETTILATTCALRDDITATTAPIGTPIANVTAHLLDERLQPVADPAPGELHIGGIALARGYLHQPELTRQRFIDDPFSPGGRLYKTGDLCRRLPDGELEFIERLDHQVKIRGLRVELGEIESQLSSHPDIRHAVVTAALDAGGEMRLAAYCVARARVGALDTIALDRHLRRFLPEHMVPREWRQMDALPVNENGKLDRKALPPIQRTAGAVPARVEWGSALRRTIAEAWARELGTERIGADDDFFALGGHSLSAARVAASLRAALHKEVTVGDLYRAPSIRGLERVISRARDINGARRVTAATTRDAGIPLAYEQLGFWLLQQAGMPNLNILGRKRVLGRIDPGALRTAFARVVDAHPALRCRMGERVPLQFVQDGCRIDVAEHDLGTLAGPQAEDAALASMDELSRITRWPPGDPLVVVRLLRRDDGVSEVQACMPHLMSDEASMQVFFDDLSSHYVDVVTGTRTPRHADEAALETFVREEREGLRGMLGRHTGFWERYFHDASPVTFPEADVLAPEQRSESVYLELPVARIDALQRMGREHALGFAELLYALALSTVAPYVEASARRRKQVVAFAPKSMRESPVYERAIGLFARMDCLKVDVTDAPDVVTLAKRLRQAAIETEGHQRCPLAVKSAGLQKRRWQSRRLQDLRSRAIARSAAALLPRADLDHEVALAHLRLTSLRRSPVRDFAVVLNVLNSFVARTEETPFGYSPSRVHAHPTFEPPLRRVLELYFLRESNAANVPLLMINGDLSVAFRRHLGHTLIGTLERVAT